MKSPGGQPEVFEGSWGDKALRTLEEQGMWVSFFFFFWNVGFYQQGSLTLSLSMASANVSGKHCSE